MLPTQRHSSQRHLTLFLFLALTASCTLLTVIYLVTMQQPPASSSPPRIILISTTYYPSLTDPRASLAIQTAQAARTHHIPYIVVDGSPTNNIAIALEQEGAIVIREDVKAMGGQGKGFAYRYGIREAMARSTALFPSTAASGSGGSGGSADYVICISEPEKIDIVRFLPQLTSILLPHTQHTPTTTTATPNILIPGRSSGGFQSLPIEQRMSEQFANQHLYNLAHQLDPPFTYTSQPVDRPLDLLFGPVLFHCSLAQYWLSSISSLWDAQIVPYIEAVYGGDGRVVGVEVEYRHPAEQTKQEEGRAEWSSKRYMQLTVVVPALEKAMREGAEKAKQKAAGNGVA